MPAFRFDLSQLQKLDQNKVLCAPKTSPHNKQSKLEATKRKDSQNKAESKLESKLESKAENLSKVKARANERLVALVQSINKEKEQK